MKKKVIFWIFGGILALVVIFSGVVFTRYQSDISYSENDGIIVKFTVKSGDNVSSVGQKLKEKGLITSKISFEIYARLNDKSNIKAGNYELTKKMKIPEILNILNNGQKVKTFSVMFLPGGTVAMAKKSLISAGFSEEESSKALSRDYSSEFPKLFANKPASADLEGFLFGETHNFKKGTSAEDVVRRFLRDFEVKIVELNLADKFKKQRLNLYEGITLASIVQKESIGCGAKLECDDQRQIAGVFLNRMKKGMNLGSDVTYQYIADKTGVARDTQLRSPYNLRIHTGLTPTPIATPSLSALNAVAEPASHEYLFFLSGDDDKTYFGVTEADHNRNIKNHCQKKCLII